METDYDLRDLSRDEKYDVSYYNDEKRFEDSELDELFSKNNLVKQFYNYWKNWNYFFFLVFLDFVLFLIFFSFIILKIINPATIKKKRLIIPMYV